MFKTDKPSLEELSFRFNERDISNFTAILEYLNSNNLLTISQNEFQKAIEGLKAIGELKQDGKVYGFNVYDTFSERQSGDGEGVELYLRQGNTLREFAVPGTRDYIYDVECTKEILKKYNIKTIYTGEIPHDSSFLGLSHECDEEDPITRCVLADYDILLYESYGINVVKLDKLI